MLSNNWVQSCAPEDVDVVPLFGSPVLYWLRYLGWWDNKDKQAIVEITEQCMSTKNFDVSH